MAGYRKRDISQFARDFFLYSTYFPLYSTELESFNPKIFMLHTKSAAFEISSRFNTDMREHVFKKTKDLVLRTDEDLLRFLVPRCIKIRHKDFFHRSLIVALAFIHEFLLYIQMNRLCYRFHFTAYKCFLATFQREYQKNWDKNGGWTGFQNEVKENIMKIRQYARNTSMLVDFRWKKLKKLFENCNSVDGEEFVLNDYELALIAEDSVQGFENNPKVVNNGPVYVNLKPSPRVVKLKAIAFYESKDRKHRISISSLIRIPPYSKPEVDGDQECDSSSDKESSDKESSDKESSDKESSDKEYSDKEYSDKEYSDKEYSDKEYSDKESSDKESSDKESSSGSTASGSTESYPDVEVDNSNDDDYESEFETRKFSDFEIYTSVTMSEALTSHGTEKFREKMMQRQCKNCGIECYKFSYDLFKKQLDSAVVRNEIA